MTVNTASGVRLAIGPAPASKTPTLMAYAAMTYVDVGEIETLGNFGDKSASVNFVSLADARTRKLKGPRDAGDMTVTVGDDPNDAGQLAMIAAEASIGDFCFCVTLNDQITSSGSSSKHYFYGKVGSKELAPGAAANVVKRNFSVWVNSPIVETSSS